MTVKDAASALQRHLMKHIEAQDFFRGEAPEVKDDMAFELQSSLPMVGQPKIALMFVFHDAIPEGDPRVARWVDGCLASARAALPEVFETAPVVVHTSRAYPGEM